MKKALSIATMALLVAGCVAKITQEEINNADYGQYPANYEQIVKDYYGNIAKDPDSLKYREITEPQKSFYNSFGDRKFGYMSCVTVNGKNSYGAYVGYKTDGLLIHNGKVIQYIQDVPRYNNLWGSRFCQM